jgi:DNA-binding response OmpR family regulator
VGGRATAGARLTKPSTEQLLLQRGAVAKGTLEMARKAAEKSGARLCSQLLAMRACDEAVLAGVLAEKHGVPGVDLSRSVIPLEATDRVPRAVAETDGILPLSLEGGRLHIALAAPRDSDRILAEVRFVTGLEVSPYIAVQGSLAKAIKAAYTAREKGEDVWRGSAAGPGLAHMAVVLPEGVDADGAEVVEVDEVIDEVMEVGGDDILPAAEADLALPEGDEIVIAVGGDDDEVVHTVSSSGGPRRVLVVDDEPEIRMLVERTLASKGFSVEVATDGEEAFARISAEPPDLVLLDAMLPKMHGFEVCRRARSDPRTRHVPIIIMTAVYRGWRFAQDARETYGAEDYIEKPFHLDDLLRRVEAVLESTASRAQPDASAAAQFKKGKELLLAGQLDGAIAAFEEAIRVEPFSAEAHHHLAKALKAKGDHFRAMTAFERAVELRQGFFQALRSLASLYTEKGFRRKAAETLERALAAAPDSATREAIKSDLLRSL